MKDFVCKNAEIKKKLEEIPASFYSRKYFHSEVDFKAFTRFKEGGQPRAIFLKAFNYIPKDVRGSFLDIGCGRGELVIFLARLGKKVFGVDYSPSAISICQEILKLERKSVKNLTNFQLADCTHLPFDNKTFQCLFLLDVVEHLTPRQLKLTLQEANRVLKNQGVLVIHTNNRYFEKLAKLFTAATYHGIKVFFQIKKTLNNASASPYEYLHINYLTGKELLCYLDKCGFDAKIEYIKPSKRAEIQEYVPYNQGWKKAIFHNLAWFLLNTPLIRFMSPAFWIVAKKR